MRVGGGAATGVVRIQGAASLAPHISPASPHGACCFFCAGPSLFSFGSSQGTYGLALSAPPFYRPAVYVTAL